MRINRGGGALWLCALWLAACGGGMDFEDYDAAYAEALCQHRARCGELSDESACVRQTREILQALSDAGQPTLVQYSGSLAAGRLRFDGDKAEACLRRFRDGACGQESEECEVLTGQQGDGAPCHITEECGPTSYCHGASVPECTPGRCTPRPGLGEKLPQDGQNGWCAPGLWPVEGICQPLVAEGGACGEARCDSGLICSWNGASLACRRYSAEGESCGEGAGWCLSHLLCESGSCHRRHGVGEACTPRSASSGGLFYESGCQLDLFCDAEPGASAGTCQVRRELGEACRLASNECGSHLACAQQSSGTLGTCQRLGGVGEKCDPGCTFGLYCDLASETCQARHKLGEACQENTLLGSCIQGLDCDGTCKPGFGGTCG